MLASTRKLKKGLKCPTVQMSSKYDIIKTFFGKCGTNIRKKVVIFANADVDVVSVD